MKQVKVQYAKTHLSALLAAVERGEEFVIARGDHPAARLVPVEPQQRRDLDSSPTPCPRNSSTRSPRKNWRTGRAPVDELPARHQRNAVGPDRAGASEPRGAASSSLLAPRRLRRCRPGNSPPNTDWASSRRPDVLLGAYAQHLDRLGALRLPVAEEHALLAGRWSGASRSRSTGCWPPRR